jgi:penicillin-binding protein 2
MHSSNTYFITNGLRAGIESIIRLGQQLHLGERYELGTRQETGGKFPTLRRISSNWYIGDSANICIGQGQMAVTPLQMAVMTAAIANGGKVLWPRLIERLEPQDLPPGAEPLTMPKGHVRDELTVKARNLQIVRDAMLADVEDPGGTGTEAFLPSIRICGKTGTAQVMDENNKVLSDNTWFASFAPYEKPRYAVIVMIESGQSGGKTCAPIARNIYRAIVERESRRMTSAAVRNDEFRMTNDERNPNDEIQKSLVADLRFGNSDFIRHSEFGIRHSPSSEFSELSEP